MKTQIKAYVRDGSLYDSETNDYLREATDDECDESALTDTGHIAVEPEEAEAEPEPETYDEAAALFRAEFGRDPDADDGDQGQLWSHVCAARSVGDVDSGRTTTTTVRIDDGDGNEVADGLDVHNWRRCACEAADRLGRTVYVSSSDASIGDDYPVEPGSTPENV